MRQLARLGFSKPEHDRDHKTSIKQRKSGEEASFQRELRWRRGSSHTFRDLHFTASFLPFLPHLSLRRDQGSTWTIFSRQRGSTRRARLAGAESDNMEACQLRSDHSGHSLSMTITQEMETGINASRTNYFQVSLSMRFFSFRLIFSFSDALQFRGGEGDLHSVSVLIKITFTPSHCCRIVCQ